MAVIQDHVLVQAILQTAVAPRTSFGIQLLLVDDAQIPIDTRYIFTTKSSLDDDFTSGTTPHDYGTVFFAQKRTASSLMIGRWAKAAVAPAFVCGSAYETGFAVWEAVSDGSFEVTDSSANTESVTAIDFTGITAFSQVVTKLNAALAALVAPSVVGLDSATFAVDSLGRLVLTMPTAGASEPTITITSDVTGTDLSTATYMDAANGSAVSGLDAEEPEEALQAISDLDDSYYNVHITGESASQQADLAAYIESKRKLLDLLTADPNAKVSGDSTDIGSVCQANSYKRTMVIYSEKTTEFPNAAVSGAVLPADEGTTSFAYEVLSSVTYSGLTKPLTVSERTILGNKNYTWIETIGDNTYLYDGITSGGEEKRVMLGRDWFVSRIEEDIFTYQLNQPVAAFDNPTLSAIEGFIWNWINEGVARKLFVNTADRPATVDLGDADDFSQAERATRELNVSNAFEVYINGVINDYSIVGNLVG